MEVTARGTAASRPAMVAALAGLVVGLAYAAISMYWAVGGTWLLDTVGISLSRPGQAGRAVALLAAWGAALVKAIAAVLPVLAVLASRGGLRTAGPRLRKLVRTLAWVEAAILIGYGLVPTATGLLVQGGVIQVAANANHLALKWHAYLWDPWFLVWGIFVFIAVWRSRSAKGPPRPAGRSGRAGMRWARR